MIPLGVLAGRRRASGGPLDVEFVTAIHETDNATIYTFPSAPLGAAADDRRILIAFHARTGGASTVTAVTVGGVSASVDLDGRYGGSVLAFARATVPTGTTGDVVVTLGSEAVRAGVGVWRVTGGALEVVDTDVNTATSGSVTVDIPAGGFALAAVTNSSPSQNLSPADYDFQMGTESGGMAGSIITGSAAYSTSGTPRAVAIAYGSA